MKRFLSILLLCALLLSLFACGKGEGEGDDPPPGEDIAEPAGEESAGEGEEVEPPDPVVLYDARNPLTGEYTMADDNVGNRPVAVIVSNYRYSRWQSGLSKADCIIEVEIENHTTQLACLFSDVRAVGAIGSVEMPFNQLSETVYPLDAVIVHYGYPNAYPRDFLKELGYVTLDGEVDSDVVYVDEKRHEEYILEYSRYTDGARIATAMEKAFPQGDAEIAPIFRFGESEKIVPSSGAARLAHVPFVSFYDVDLRYSEESGRYEKWQFNFIHTDKDANNRQLEFENAFILFAQISATSDTAGLTRRLVEVDYAAGGSGYWLSGGRYQEIDWKKPTPSDFFSFYDKAGNELTINPGKSYIAVVDTVSEEFLDITE